MSEKKKGCKDCLVTIRMTDEDVHIVDYLSDCMDKSRSDVISRACKFYLNVDDNYGDSDMSGDYQKKERKNRKVHLRMTGSDVKMLTEKGEKIGESISQTIRKAIKMYNRVGRKPY